MTNRTDTTFNGDIIVKGDDGLTHVHLAGQSDYRSIFHLDCEVKGYVYTNDIGVHPDKSDKVLSIGNSNNNLLNLQSKENISMVGINRVYINSQGEIVIESPTSITLRAPEIIFEGEIKHGKFDGPYLSNYVNDIKNAIVTTISPKGAFEQVFKTYTSSYTI
jgi:hypothetical protein